MKHKGYADILYLNNSVPEISERKGEKFSTNNRR